MLVDQVLQMQRSGFTQAVLATGQRIEHAQRLLAHYPAFYQGDALQIAPRFVAA